MMLQVGEMDSKGRKVVKCTYRVVKCRCGANYKTWVGIDKDGAVISKRNHQCYACERMEELIEDMRRLHYPGTWVDPPEAQERRAKIFRGEI